jgi:hypothetical protein
VSGGGSCGYSWVISRASSRLEFAAMVADEFRNRAESLRDETRPGGPPEDGELYQRGDRRTARLRLRTVVRKLGLIRRAWTADARMAMSPDPTRDYSASQRWPTRRPGLRPLRGRPDRGQQPRSRTTCQRSPSRGNRPASRTAGRRAELATTT